MKNKIIYLSIICAAIVLSSCKKMFQAPEGELIGASYGSSKKGVIEGSPLGMVFIEGGNFTMGPMDAEQTEAQGVVARNISVNGFWMDDTEITNAEYRQFIFWVRDSLLRTKLAELEPEYRIDEDRFGNPVDPPRINWARRIDYKRNDNVKLIYEEELYLKPGDRIAGQPLLDVRKLLYRHTSFDMEAALRSSVNNAGQQGNPAGRNNSFIREEVTPVYPDTLCWFTDFALSLNEPLIKNYFWHPAYDQYPVVGVTWTQAQAFCKWRTKYYNNAMAARGITTNTEFTLPLESEWEYAARGGLSNSIYPWGGPNLTNSKGCYLANFKPRRGDYASDGWYTTAPVGSFDPNGYGLYDMAGNVAEWTQSAYDESYTAIKNDMDPDYTYNAAPDDPPAMKRKVVRGGSWKDTKYYLNVGIKTYEYQDSARSYIGFRCIKRSIGSKLLK